MNFNPILTFVLALTLFYCVQSKKTCDITKIECTTNGGENVIKSIIAGIDGLIEPIEPIRQAEVKGQWGNLKYTMSNGTLSGISNCEFTLLKLNTKESTYQANLHCPQLVETHYFVVNGKVGLTEMNGEGFATVTYNDYIIIIDGKYDEHVSEKDQNSYYSIVSHDAEFDPKGKVTVHVDGPLHPDKTKDDLAKNFMNERSDEIEKVMRSPIMVGYTTVLMEAVDTYLRNFPTHEIFPEKY